MKDKELLIEIGKRIKDRRKELGLSQLELAEKVGYTSKATLSLIENGKRDISSPQLKKIATALDTSVDYLLGITNYIHIEIDYGDDKVKKKDYSKIVNYFEQLSDKNKQIAETYLKFLVENQKEK